MKKVRVYQGKVRRNIYGDWSDVDRGIFVGYEDIETMFLGGRFDSGFEGMNVKVTIETIEDDEREEE